MDGVGLERRGEAGFKGLDERRGEAGGGVGGSMVRIRVKAEFI